MYMRFIANYSGYETEGNFEERISLKDEGKWIWENIRFC